MLENGNHPNAIRNTINKQRLGNVAKDVNQDQKRLDEEPRCKTCGVAKSRHTRWTAELTQDDSGARHPFVASTAT
jgi:hypothetical protein